MKVVWLNGCRIVWDGDQLTSETDEGYTEIGYAVADQLQLLDKNTTELKIWEGRLQIGDKYKMYEYCPVSSTWMLLCPPPTNPFRNGISL